MLPVNPLVVSGNEAEHTPPPQLRVVAAHCAATVQVPPLGVLHVPLVQVAVPEPSLPVAVFVRVRLVP